MQDAGGGALATMPAYAQMVKEASRTIMWATTTPQTTERIFFSHCFIAARHLLANGLTGG